MPTFIPSQTGAEGQASRTNVSDTSVHPRSDALAKRRLKRLVANLPARPWIKLLYLLFLKGGILDGPAGWLYCRMQAHYEFMCVTILRDLRSQ